MPPSPSRARRSRPARSLRLDRGVYCPLSSSGGRSATGNPRPPSQTAALSMTLVCSARDLPAGMSSQAAEAVESASNGAPEEHPAVSPTANAHGATVPGRGRRPCRADGGSCRGRDQAAARSTPRLPELSTLKRAAHDDARRQADRGRPCTTGRSRMRPSSSQGQRRPRGALPAGRAAGCNPRRVRCRRALQRMGGETRRAPLGRPSRFSAGCRYASTAAGTRWTAGTPATRPRWARCTCAGASPTRCPPRPRC